MNRQALSIAADNAADYIEQHGWCRNRPNDENGRVCMGNALIQGNRVRHHDGQWYSALTPIVHEMTGFPRITAYNDAPERTQEEVVDVLRNVAIKYREDAMTIESGGR